MFANIEQRDAHMQRESITEWPEFERTTTDEKIRMLRGDLPHFVLDRPRPMTI